MDVQQSAHMNSGFILDSNLTMKQHVIKVCQTAYYGLKRINSIRTYLTEDATKMLVASCVLSRLDYCHSLFMGTPASVIRPMQKVHNAAARLILRASRHQHCTPLLQQLHWLPISEHIKYKTACMCYNSITGSAPLTFLNYHSCTALPALSALHLTHVYSNSDASTAKHMAFALSPISVFTSGTTFPKTSDTLLLSLPSKTNSKHFSSLRISTECYCPSPQQSVYCLCMRTCARAHTHTHAHAHAHTHTHTHTQSSMPVQRRLAMLICTFSFLSLCLKTFIISIYMYVFNLYCSAL